MVPACAKAGISTLVHKPEPYVGPAERCIDIGWAMLRVVRPRPFDMSAGGVKGVWPSQSSFIRGNPLRMGRHLLNYRRTMVTIFTR